MNKNRLAHGRSLMRSFGMEPDPWQLDVLGSDKPRLLLNCCRQAGKSTVVAVLGLVEALTQYHSKVLLVSRSHRQSRELFRTLIDFYGPFQQQSRERQTSEELVLHNGSRIVSLPCREETIRGYSRVTLLVIDEAARVPDDLYRSVRPMLAVSQGRIICLSTPFGKRGFFYDVWSRGGDDWQRIEVPAERIPRIPQEFLEQERRGLGEAWFRQEYCCSFEALEGLVYPDFARCVVQALPPHVCDPSPLPLSPKERGDWHVGSKVTGAVLPSPLSGEGLGVRGSGQRVGGIDFGFRNPFAAVWGTLDRDGVLWLTGEHYERQRPLSHHAQRLPKDVLWYADPAGANERSELICAGFSVRKGDNDLRLGIAAVTARLENGTLKVLHGRCPNLLHEASLYRYDSESATRSPETPLDVNNHALAALRYLVSRLDARKLACGTGHSTAPPQLTRPWLRLDNEALWQTL